jgi:hypothetical protein
MRHGQNGRGGGSVRGKRGAGGPASARAGPAEKSVGESELFSMNKQVPGLVPARFIPPFWLARQPAALAETAG